MTTIDWKQAAEKYRDDIITDLSSLVSIKSERDVEHKTDEFPLGPGVSKALQKMLSIAQRDGFKTKNIENLAGHVEFGEGSETLGILGHMDVVPAGEGWNTDPYVATIKDGKIFGRGTSDDKGPSVAAYYGLKLIKDSGLPVSKKVRFIFGTDEESNWTGINRYLEVEPEPDFAFSPDAEFPIINGEKGIASFKITFNDDPTEKSTIKSFVNGIRANMIPQSSKVTLNSTVIDVTTVTTNFKQFIADNNLTGSVDTENDELILNLTGKGSHAMEPQKGINSATYLAKFLTTLKLNKKENEYFNFISEVLHLDYEGEKLGINYSDSIMGPLTTSPTVYSYNSNEAAATILVNVRYPKGKSDQELVSLISKNLPASASVELDGHAQPPHFVDPEDKLVKTLVETYRDYVDDDTEPMSIGGGTYGRMLKRGVAFGGLLPGRENVMHQANEYMLVDDLVFIAAIYADAIYRLIK